MIKISNLSFKYNGKEILNDINLEIFPNEVFIILGPNGSGKTTLLKSMSGILKPTNGNIYLDMKNIHKLKPKEIAKNITCIEQEINVGFDFTVKQIVELGRIIYKSLRNKAEDSKIVEIAMKEVDVYKFASKSIFKLSSGEKQRVWLAMALAQTPKMLMLDEPTSHLDISYQIEILNLIRLLSKKGISVILTMHDINLAANYADRIAFIKNGKIIQLGKPDKIINENLIEKVFNVKTKIIKDLNKNFFIGIITKDLK